MWYARPQCVPALKRRSSRGRGEAARVTSGPRPSEARVTPFAAGPGKRNARPSSGPSWIFPVLLDDSEAA
jgi:hypothetical protein